MRFSLCGLLRMLHGIVLWDYENVNTKYFIINSKLTALRSHNCPVVLAYIYIHAHWSSCRRESDDERHTHPCPPLILYVHKHNFSVWAPISTFRSASITHTSSCPLEIWFLFTHTYTHPYPCWHSIACSNTFFLHTYRGISLTRMRHYTQLVYLFHQYAMSHLSRRLYCRLYCETSRREVHVFIDFKFISWYFCVLLIHSSPL